MERISIVIPVRNNFELTIQTIQSIKENCFLDHEIIVVDDASSDETQKFFTQKMIDQTSDVMYFRFNENIGVTRAWNFGIDVAVNDYVMVINNDVLFKPGIDVMLVKALQSDEDVYVTGPLTTSGVKPRRGDYTFVKNNICGHCRMIRKDNWHEIGPIDDRIKIYFNDDYIYNTVLKKLKKKINVASRAYCHHLGHKTIEKEKGIHMKVLKDDVSRQIICAENGR